MGFIGQGCLTSGRPAVVRVFLWLLEIAAPVVKLQQGSCLSAGRPGMCSMQAEHCQYMTEPEQMYHQQQQQFHDHRQHMSSRPSLSPENKFFMKGQGGAGAGGGGDAGLILSTDAKPRLKWTPELHERFADAVKKLGGPDSK
uniref:HTH myb-type domain-containing protein n=1 Tax=Aegilops tauschii subsp. strangulata TaxID=200361 RepID=A0A453AN26_AEGTS